MKQTCPKGQDEKHNYNNNNNLNNHNKYYYNNNINNNNNNNNIKKKKKKKRGSEKELSSCVFQREGSGLQAYTSDNNLHLTGE